MNEELKIIISAEIEKLKQGIADAKGEVEGLTKGSKVSLEEFSAGFTKVGDVATQGLKVAAGAIAGVTTAILALGPATAEYRNEQAKLVTAFETTGSSAAQATTTYNDLYRVLGESDVAVEAAGHLAQLTSDQQALSEWTTICQGVYATFGDSLPIESLTEAANETAKTGELTGALADALNWAGVNEADFQAKLAACNTEAEREQMIRQTLSGLYDEAAAGYEKNAAATLKQNEANAKLQDSMAKVGEAVSPLNTMLTELGAEILADLAPYIEDFANEHGPDIQDALSDIGEKVGEVLKFVSDHWDIISTVGGIIGAIAVAIGVASTALGVYNTVMGITAVVSAPVLIGIVAITAAIALLVAGIALAIKHWDDIKEAASKAVEAIKTKATEMKDKVVEKFNELKEKATQKIEELKTKATEKFEGLKTAATEKVEAAKTAVVNKFNEMKDKASEKIENLKTAASEKFEGIKTVATQKIDAAKTTVVNKFEEMKSGATTKLEGIKTAASDKFGIMKDTISQKMDGARNAVKGAIDKMKSYFNFKWELPKFKLPHLSVSGKFSLDPPKVPKFDVKWYARGGVFDKPTLFGYGNGVGGLGENGAEAVVPLENNLQWLDKLSNMLAARLGGANTPVILEVDGKVFAETSINTINQLTRQTGKLNLVLI